MEAWRSHVIDQPEAIARSYVTQVSFLPWITSSARPQEAGTYHEVLFAEVRADIMIHVILHPRK